MKVTKIALATMFAFTSTVALAQTTGTEGMGQSWLLQWAPIKPRSAHRM